MAVSLPNFAPFDVNADGNAGPRWEKWLARLKRMFTVTDRARSLYHGVNYYHLEDWLRRRVKGRFYEPQLQKVKDLPSWWHVAKTRKYKGRGATRQILVNCQGVISDYQTRIPTQDLEKYE